MSERTDDAVLAFIVHGLDDPLYVQDLEVVEGLSTLYEVRARVRHSAPSPLSPEALERWLLAPASFVFVGARGMEDPWYGLVTELTELTPKVTAVWEYRVVIRPRLWAATQTLRSRMFHNASVLDIARKILGDLGLQEGPDFAVEVGGGHNPAPYVVQYEETDFAFLSRLLEHHGVTYYFVHDVDHPGEKLVLTDSDVWATRAAGSIVTFARQPGVDALHELERRYVAVPETVVVRDYQPMEPSATLSESAPVAQGNLGVQVMAGEGFGSSAEGVRLAGIRAQEIACTKHLLTAETMVRGLHAGYKFGLAGFPNPAYDGRDYVVVSARHHLGQVRTGTEGDGPEPYRSRVELLPVDVAYRPVRKTPRPKVYGGLPGRVAGGSGPAAPIDGGGQYQVLFSYDTEQTASRRVPMAQPYSGAAYGMHFPLHTGAEVVVVHVDGDLDRPVIVGTVPHGATPTPVAEGNATQSAIVTHNRIVMEFEDDA